MTHKILKSTSRGQITLPKQWRSHFSTDSYFVEMHDDKLVIKPLHLEEMEGEEVLFDADRDNEGTGLSPDDLIRTLKKIRNG